MALTFLLSRCGLAAWVAVQPKGRFTSWTRSGTRSWRNFRATLTKCWPCARLRTATSSVELGNMMGRSPSGRWSEDGRRTEIGTILECDFLLNSLSWNNSGTPWKMKGNSIRGKRSREKNNLHHQDMKEQHVYMKYRQPGQLFPAFMKQLIW